MSVRTPADRRRHAEALPQAPQVDVDLVARFLDAIWAERGLSLQTMAGYRRDLTGLARWLQGRRHRALLLGGTVASSRH